MTLWSTSLLILVLLYSIPSHAQIRIEDNTATITEDGSRTAVELPHPLSLTKRDREITQAYADVFRILSDQNTCSSFYGGSRTATAVLNDFVPAVESHQITRAVTFRMSGRLRVLHEPVSGASYRLFEKVTVNSNSSFYKRRVDALVKFPSDVGSFPPGTRAARALILLHELGHLIQGQSGDWLLPNDGYDDALSRQNTLRVQQVCRPQLQALH